MQPVCSLKETLPITAGFFDPPRWGLGREFRALKIPEFFKPRLQCLTTATLMTSFLVGTPVLASYVIPARIAYLIVPSLMLTGSLRERNHHTWKNRAVKILDIGLSVPTKCCAAAVFAVKNALGIIKPSIALEGV